jgi:hypothetical protein
MLAVLVFVLALLLAGCEALTMTPDAWLHPPRWEAKEMARMQAAQAQKTDLQRSTF